MPSPHDPVHWVALVVGALGLLCFAFLSRFLRPDVRRSVYAGELLLHPSLLTRSGRRLLALGWLCVIIFNVWWWGGTMFR